MLEECLYQELLTDVVDIILHCVDHNHLKQRPLHEVFPPVQTFHQVIYSRYLMGYEAGVLSRSGRLKRKERKSFPCFGELNVLFRGQRWKSQR
jgi:hypothetical protein